ncbi:MAG: PLP-dependent aminotransferase family protein [Myxococcales bacterium]|jgi:GntR family transcriptional regulator/MocR family aminotransferase
MDQIGPIELDPTLDTPLYQQLFDAIAALIGSGALAPGQRLPPTRALAQRLGAHRNTVVRAYGELEDAGFVTGTVGRGTFVRRPPEGVRAVQPSAAPSGIAWGTLLSRQSAAEPLRRAERFAQASAGRGAINMVRMQPSADLLPDQLFRRCLDHVLATLGGRALGYAPRPGVARLREQIALDLERQGVSTTADDVLVTSGSQQALDLLVRALVNPGEPMIVDSVTYTGALSAFSVGGARLLTVPSDDEGPDLAALERLGRTHAKAFYLMPSCQNPTGRCISLSRRRALVDWSRRTGVPLIEDDYVSDLHVDAPPPAPLRGFDGDVLYVGTYSKKLIPAVRVGYVVAPPPLRKRLEALKQVSDMGSPLIQYALAEFLERGYLRAHLSRTLPEYRARRDALEGALREHLPEGLSVRRPVSGLNLWLPLPERVDSHQVFEAARDEGVLVMPATMNRATESGENGIRMNFCAEPPERLREGGERLGRALQRVLSECREGDAELEAAAVI